MRGVVSGNVGQVYKAEFVGQYFLLSFSVAESVYLGRDKGKESCWHKCEYWGRGAEAISSYLTVGQHVDVMGQAYLQKWTSKDGTPGKTLIVKANDVVLGASRQESPAATSGPPTPATTSAPPSRPAGQTTGFGDDDIPF